MKTLNYIPDLLQYGDFNCGDSCVQEILAYYGVDINESRLIKKLKTRKNDGTSVKHIIKFFIRKDFKIKAGSMALTQLKRYIKKKIPVILFIQAAYRDSIDYTDTYAYGHFVIACGYDKNRIIFEDPAIFGKGYITNKELMKRWNGEDGNNEYLINYGIAV